MAPTPAAPLNPVIQSVIDKVIDRKRLSAGIDACETRRGDFANIREMQLTGLAMIPEARQLMSDTLTETWGNSTGRSFPESATVRQREVVIGSGFSAAVYCANRVKMGFPKPLVLEQHSADRVGGAFAMSLNPVFRLNSRSRPGTVGLPDQDKALNYLPGGLLQPAMVSSEEYPTNADMAWLIRLTLAQYAVVYPDVTVTGIAPHGEKIEIKLTTSAGEITPGRLLDARGTGTEFAEKEANGTTILTFSQFMARMGGMFPLRGMQQFAIVGGGNSGLCTAESALGIAPGHTSAIGLDYVRRVDLYAPRIDGRSCDDFRQAQRGRYIRLAQYLAGNVSNPSTRLQVLRQSGYATPMPDGALVNDRTYDMAVLATGSALTSLNDPFSYRPVRRRPADSTLAVKAVPFECYRIGVAAGIEFSEAEISSGIADNPANQVAMFRNGPRIAALAAMLPGL